MQHGVLHGQFQTFALAGVLAPVQRRQDRDRQQHARAGIAKCGARFDRRSVRIAGDAHDAAAGLGNHVKGQVVFERAACAETLDLGIDQRGIDLGQDVIAQAKTLDRAGGEILYHHIR